MRSADSREPGWKPRSVRISRIVRGGADLVRSVRAQTAHAWKRQKWRNAVRGAVLPGRKVGRICWHPDRPSRKTDLYHGARWRRRPATVGSPDRRRRGRTGAVLVTRRKANLLRLRPGWIAMYLGERSRSGDGYANWRTLSRASFPSLPADAARPLRLYRRNRLVRK